MFKYLLSLHIIAVVISQDVQRKEWTVSYPCADNKNIKIFYENHQPTKDVNFYLLILVAIPDNTFFHVKLDVQDRFPKDYDNKTLYRNLRLVTQGHFITRVKNPSWSMTLRNYTDILCYLRSVKFNQKEYCENLTYVPIGLESKWDSSLRQNEDERDDYCGRSRAVPNRQLNVAKYVEPDEWPWHAILHRRTDDLLNHFCAGTLLSKSAVLTAGHCLIDRDKLFHPGALGVTLGKQNLLVTKDKNIQYHKVQQVLIHDNYEYNISVSGYKDADIGLLKLTKEVVFNEFVKPACLWYPSDYNMVPDGQIMGTVAGWGMDQSKRLNNKLRRVNMPLYPQYKCVSQYRSELSHYTFCAGARGKVNCIGDGGGGLLVFVPDISGDNSPNATGSWHVRGVTSPTIVVNETACNPKHYYVTYTDTALFLNWLIENID